MQHPKVVAIASRHTLPQVAVIDLRVICKIAAHHQYLSHEIRRRAEYSIIGYGTVLHFRVLPPHCADFGFRWKSREEATLMGSALWEWIVENFEELTHSEHSPWYLLYR